MAFFFFPNSGEAQFTPFSDVGVQSDGARGPEELFPDPEEPALYPRRTTADKIARLFDSNLREVEEAQKDIVAELELLPKMAREVRRLSSFGYHSGTGKQHPKWVQIDMGESIEPEAIALFPATAEFDDGTVYGYGFPRKFRIDISDDRQFSEYQTMVEGVIKAPQGVKRWPFFRVVSGFEGRYIRVTATEMWRSERTGKGVFALSEIMVFKGDLNIAALKGVDASDKSYERSDRWRKHFVTDSITSWGVARGDIESETYGFRAKTVAEVEESWIQLDLGSSMPIDEVRLILADQESFPDQPVDFGYPLKIQVSDSPDMAGAELVGQFSLHQIRNIGLNPLVAVPDGKWEGRYVRVTAFNQQGKVKMGFDLAEVEVYSGYKNVARNAHVRATHSVNKGKWNTQYLVDGFSSRRNLIPYNQWLADLDKRQRLMRRWVAKEEERLNLVDKAVTRGVIFTVLSVAGGLAFVFVALSRGQVRRKKELEALRQRIASDLHDDIGSNLSSIALLAELGKTEAEEPELVLEELTEIKSTADKTIESMRDIVWLIRPGEETWQQMLTRFRETAAKLLRMHEYTLKIEGEAYDDRLPLEFKRDIFLIYKEVLNNIVRHAQAENVTIEIDSRRNRLQLVIEDDGIGFDSLDDGFREGNGLRNLRVRAQSIGANLKVRSAESEGTRIELLVPMP